MKLSKETLLQMERSLFVYGKAFLEVAKSSNGKHGELFLIPTQTVFKTQNSEDGVSYVQVVDGKPYVVFSEKDIVEVVA